MRGKLLIAMLLPLSAVLISMNAPNS
jgi:hypothetical protein